MLDRNVTNVYVYVCKTFINMEDCTMRFSKSQIKSAEPSRISVLPYMEKRDSFVDECIDLANEWRENHASFVGSKSKKQLRADLKSYILARSDQRSGSVLWMIIARIVLTWVVNWIIDNYLSDENL